MGGCVIGSCETGCGVRGPFAEDDVCRWIGVRLAVIDSASLADARRRATPITAGDAVWCPSGTCPRLSSGVTARLTAASQALWWTLVASCRGHAWDVVTPGTTVPDPCPRGAARGNGRPLVARVCVRAPGTGATAPHPMNGNETPG